jgi:DNA repair protein REV1
VCHSVSQSVASTSEIAAANYAARAFGIRAGTRLGKARSLCPQLVSLPYQFEAYTQTSRNLYACLFGFTHSVEILSCDEALLEFDATQFQSSKERVTELCQELRDAVKAATGCNASTGAAGMCPVKDSLGILIYSFCRAFVSGSVLLARMATQRAKPNGLFVLPIMSLTPSQSSMEDVDQNSPVAVITRFVQSCSLDDLPGVGWSNSHSLAAEPYLIKSIDDVLRTPLASLQTAMSSETAGTKLYWAARGREWPQPRPLSVHKQRKSVSAEITWGL